MLLLKVLATLLSTLGITELGVRYGYHTSAATVVQQYAGSFGIKVFQDGSSETGEEPAVDFRACSQESFKTFASLTHDEMAEKMEAAKQCHAKCGHCPRCHGSCPQPMQPMARECDAIAPVLDCHAKCFHSRGGRGCHGSCPLPPPGSKFAPALQSARDCHHACADGDCACHRSCPHPMFTIARKCDFVKQKIGCHQACAPGDFRCHHACPKMCKMWGGEKRPLHV
mmetsp:Transcript_122633/g.354463  ORF Transcript_122633/g.354463 Transcript_122633/m.354463 type:complete len:226 (+) Transcript_122633:66-743(+)